MTILRPDDLDGWAEIGQVATQAATRLAARLFLAKTFSKLNSAIARCRFRKGHHFARCWPQIKCNDAAFGERRNGFAFIFRHLFHRAQREMGKIGMNGTRRLPAMRCGMDNSFGAVGDIASREDARCSGCQRFRD